MGYHCRETPSTRERGHAAMIRKLKEPVFDDDNPEWTEEDFAIATRFEGGIKATDLTPEILARIARRAESVNEGGRSGANCRALPQPALHHRGLNERCEQRMRFEWA